MDHDSRKSASRRKMFGQTEMRFTLLALFPNELVIGTQKTNQTHTKTEALIVSNTKIIQEWICNYRTTQASVTHVSTEY